MLSSKELKKVLKLADNKAAGVKKKGDNTRVLAKLGEHLLEHYKETACNKKEREKAKPEASKKAPLTKKASSGVRTKTIKISSDPKALVYIDGACRGNGLASSITGVGIYWRWSCLGREFDEKDDVLDHMAFEDAQKLLFEDYLNESPDDRWKDRVTNQRAESLALALVLVKLHELYFWRHENGVDDSLRTDRNYIFCRERASEEERSADAKRRGLLQEKKEVTICTDSTWTRDCATTWAQGWSRAAEANGTTDWKNSTGEFVVHQDIHKVSYAIIQDLMNDGLVVKIEYTKGHSGVYGNMVVDALARYSTNQINYDQLKIEIASLKRGLKIYDEERGKGGDETDSIRTGSITLSSLLGEGEEKQ